MNTSVIITSLKAVFPTNLVDQVIETYSEVKRNLYLGHLRPNEVEGGRFAEAVLRLLEFRISGHFTPLGQQIDTDRLIRELANLPSNSHPDSIRLHIPRTLRVIYDIRNRRDAAHLADGIDPNLQDATLVSACCDWILAELVRLFHGIDANDAQEIIDGLVSKKAPVVQEFGDILKTLRPDFTIGERVLVLLYQRGQRGATSEELSSWVKPSQRKMLKTNVWKLIHDKDFVVEYNGRFLLTRSGQLEVERKKLLHFS